MTVRTNLFSLISLTEPKYSIFIGQLHNLSPPFEKISSKAKEKNFFPGAVEGPQVPFFNWKNVLGSHFRPELSFSFLSLAWITFPFLSFWLISMKCALLFVALLALAVFTSLSPTNHAFSRTLLSLSSMPRISTTLLVTTSPSSSSSMPPYVPSSSLLQSCFYPYPFCLVVRSLQSSCSYLGPAWWYLLWEVCDLIRCSLSSFALNSITIFVGISYLFITH